MDKALRQREPVSLMLRVEEIISGAKLIPKIDATHGFWQLKIDEETNHSGPEIFHSVMEQIIDGLVGVREYVEDLVVWGSTQN